VPELRSEASALPGLTGAFVNSVHFDPALSRLKRFDLGCLLLRAAAEILFEHDAILIDDEEFS
jgi:hypothetical protein